MSYRKVNFTNEAALRDAILTYFLDGKPVEGMESEEPFATLVREKVFTWERIKLVRRSLVAAGLLAQIRGSTADMVLRTTDIGRQMVKAEEA